eukprot:5375394-Pyramimonas_sp.AAC.1
MPPPTTGRTHELQQVYCLPDLCRSSRSCMTFIAAMQSAASAAGMLATCPRSTMPTCSGVAGVGGNA